ncbi:MAG: patatin [Candidatus Peribacteria bacterium]|nr:patatin [Candidatus Peribacteria bacterium]
MPFASYESMHENRRFKANIADFDEKIRHGVLHADRLEDRRVFSATELQRLHFLMRVVSCMEQPPPSAGSELSAWQLGRLELQAIRQSFNGFNEAPHIDRKQFFSSDLRMALQAVEGLLATVRDREHAESDSQTQVGKMILNTRQKVGVAFGGGLVGLGHVGVVDVLQQQGIPVHAIAGSSMGAVIGGVLAGYIGTDHQIEPQGVSYMKNVVRNIRAWEQLTENREEKTILPLDRILSMNGACRMEYEQLLHRRPAVPYYAQVAEHSNPTSRRQMRRDLFLSAGTQCTMQEIIGVGGLAAASSALKVKFGFQPVRIGAKVYSDDTSIFYKSTYATVKKLRKEGADVVISIPVSFIDSDIWQPLQKILDYMPGHWADRGDVEIRSKAGHGILSGSKSLTTFQKGFPRGQKYARTNADITSGKRIPLPVDELMEAGAEAAHKKMPAIRALLGLRPLGRIFQK